jgi:hypothetical protein
VLVLLVLLFQQVLLLVLELRLLLLLLLLLQALLAQLLYACSRLAASHLPLLMCSVRCGSTAETSSVVLVKGYAAVRRLDTRACKKKLALPNTCTGA